MPCQVLKEVLRKDPSTEETREYEIPIGGTRISNPRNYFSLDEQRRQSLESLMCGDLRSAMMKGFGLAANDSYVYHAIASVTLAQVQDAIEAGRANGLCDWYQDADGHQVCLLLI